MNNTYDIYKQSSEDMSQVPDDSVHLIITSPPYCVGIDYDTYDDTKSREEHMAFLLRIWTECKRVLCEGGRIAINVADIGRNPYWPMSAFITMQMLELGFHQRGVLVWEKGCSSSGYSSTAWGSWMSASNPTLRDSHEFILVFSKGPMKRPDSKDKISTISKERFLKDTRAVWEIHTANPKQIGHPVPFPVELPKRLIDLYSFGYDTILDPFSGSGSTGVAAKLTGRSYIGYDVSDEYNEIAKRRIADTTEGIPTMPPKKQTKSQPSLLVEEDE